MEELLNKYFARKTYIRLFHYLTWGIGGIVMVDIDKLNVFPAFDNFDNDIEIIIDNDCAIILLKRDKWLVTDSEEEYIIRLCAIVNHEFIHWIIYSVCGVEEDYDGFLKELGIYNIDGFLENWM